MINREFPVLYSFRRCPYAMRARLAIKASGINVELREILLTDKPTQMLKISEKATVPVLQLIDGSVIDESIDIMVWCLNQNDSLNLLDEQILKEAQQLIKLNDGEFKSALDKYKYAVRFPEHSEVEYRKDAEFFLDTLDNKLKRHQYLLSSKVSIADYAIFPFIRQFASVDKAWFEQSQYHYLIEWLNGLIKSELFNDVMKKYKVWKIDQKEMIVF
jgi:glutathione S-transferase